MFVYIIEDFVPMGTVNLGILGVFSEEEYLKRSEEFKQCFYKVTKKELNKLDEYEDLHNLF